MDARYQRGMTIAATAKVVRKGSTWRVPSQSGPTAYTVKLAFGARSCTCLDHETRGAECKHIIAAEIVMRREEGADGTVTETRAMRVTYAQNWSAYNAAQTTEKEHFCRLLRDLVSTVPSPPQKTGRPRLPLADALFCAGFKVYSTASGRRVQTDLREAAAKGLISRAPHYNSLFEVVESESLTPILHGLIEASSLPLREVESDFAADSTGFGMSQFSRYYTAKYRGEQIGRGWVKVHAMVGVKTNVITAVEVGDHRGNDCPRLPGLLEATAKNFTVREVSADKAYLSKRNLAIIDGMGAKPFIPMKFNSGADPSSPAWNKLFHLFAFHREEFAAHYHKRSNVETTFSMVKRVFGDHVRSKTWTAQVNEVLLKLLCHNVRVLVHEMHELGVQPSFGVS